MDTENIKYKSLFQDRWLGEFGKEKSEWFNSKWYISQTNVQCLMAARFPSYLNKETQNDPRLQTLVSLHIVDLCWIKL